MIGVQADVLTALCAGVALGLLIARGAPCSAAARLLRATSRCFAKEVSGETPPTAPRAHSTSATAPHLRSPRSGRTRFQTQALVETIESLGDDDIDALIDAFQAQHGRAPESEELEAEIFRSQPMSDVIDRHLSSFQDECQAWISNRLAVFDERDDRSVYSGYNGKSTPRNKFKASLEATAKILLAERSQMLRQDTRTCEHTRRLDDLCLANILSFCSVGDAGMLAIADRGFSEVFSRMCRRFTDKTRNGVDLADKTIAALQDLKPLGVASSRREGTSSTCLALRVFRALNQHRAHQARAKAMLMRRTELLPSSLDNRAVTLDRENDDLDFLLAALNELDVNGAHEILMARGFDPHHTYGAQAPAESLWSGLLQSRGRPALAGHVAMFYEEFDRTETPFEMAERIVLEETKLVRMTSLLIAYGCDPSDSVRLRWKDQNENHGLEQILHYQNRLDAAVGHLDLPLVKFLVRDCGMKCIVPFTAPHDSVLVDIYCAIPRLLAAGEILSASYYVVEEDVQKLITTECAFRPIREFLLKHGAPDNSFAKWDLAISSAMAFVRMEK